MRSQRVGGQAQHVFVGLAALGAVACAGILGIDDRGLDPELADGSVAAVEGSTPNGGDTGTGSSGDDAGADASADAGAGAGAGAGADAGASADAGAGADASAGADAGASADAALPEGGATGPACATACLMASGLNHPFLMTSDANSVYWTEFGDDLGSGNGSVKACPVTGCGAGPFVYAPALTNPRGIAVDATNIYFATASYSGIVGGIWTCPLSGCGGSPTELATAGIPYGVAVDGTYVYWVDNDDNTVHKVEKTVTGARTDHTLYDAASDLVVEPGECVVAGPYLFFMDANADALRISTNGGEPVVMGTSTFGGQFGITTDPTHVYFGGLGVVLRSLQTLADGGAPIAQTIADPTGLAFNPAGSMVYWSNWGSGNGSDGTIGRMATDGGAQHILASSLAPPEAVTVSGKYALWISNGTLSADAGIGTISSSGSLWEIAK